MNVVVIYESLTGNTRRAAELIGGAAKAAGAEVSVRSITNLDLNELARADVVFVGTWVDGLILLGHRPGRVKRFWTMPVLDGKPVAAFMTYAINPGGALRKFVRVLEGVGAEVVAARQFRRDRVERDVAQFVADAFGRVPV
ncbi:MAG: flavodoxin family protein [Acidimicrobiales bacterium]